MKTYFNEIDEDCDRIGDALFSADSDDFKEIYMMQDSAIKFKIVEEMIKVELVDDENI